MTQMTLASIEEHYTTEPPRIVIYGPHGIGKTTFGAAAPGSVILPIEKGLASATAT
jgi:replication-associated recombination protein RarA